MQLTEAVKRHLLQTAASLHGSDRRLFLARTVRLLGRGGRRRAEHELGWNRVTIRKGMHELESGIVCLDAFSQRGRLRARAGALRFAGFFRVFVLNWLPTARFPVTQCENPSKMLDSKCARPGLRAEERLPHLLEDIKALVDAQSQTDPRFRTQRLYTRLSAAAVRRQLIEQKGYGEHEVPAVRTPGAKVPPVEWIGLLFFPFGVLLGPALAWWREALGAAAVAAVSVTAFYVYYVLLAGRLRPVGSLRPNDLGLFDLHGNAWEWCQNTVNEFPDVNDQQLEDAVVNGISRLLRGGAYHTDQGDLWSGRRHGAGPEWKTFPAVGFRLARTLR